MTILYTPDDPEFADFETRFVWVERVLLASWSEIEQPEALPESLNWLALLPEGSDLDIEDVECSLVCLSESGYCASVWDASGVEDDLPWAVFLVDDFGVRFFSEYSLFESEEEQSQSALETVLARAEQELPDRLLAGEFDRVGEPLEIPSWLSRPVFREENQ